MSEREIIKEYNTEGISVIWKPKKCIHSGVCVKTLPEVYKPNAKPWINPDNASVKELKDQIDLCPSGALSYRFTNSTSETSADDNKPVQKVEVLQAGPLMVHGEMEVTLADGSIEVRKRSTAFCRCGGSQKKPYCDGSHKTNGFSEE